MSDDLFFVVELEVKPGQIDELRSVMEEMVGRTRTDEPGTVGYEWFLSADGTACHIYERYADEAGVLAHSATFPETLSRRAQAFRPIQLTAYGTLTDAIREKRIEPLRKAVLGISVILLEPLGGFTREVATAKVPEGAAAIEGSS